MLINYDKNWLTFLIRKKNRNVNVKYFEIKWITASFCFAVQYFSALNLVPTM